MPDTITYAEQAADVLAAVASAIAAKTPFALITSIGISGGSARPLGSLAMVGADGRMVGYLSNGCIDRDIQLRGQMAIETGRREVLHYGQGSPYLDLKLPCGGALKVLVDPMPDHSALLDAHTALQSRQIAELDFTIPNAEPIRFAYRPKFRLVLAGRGAAFRATAAVAHAAGFEVNVMSPEQDDLDALQALSARPTRHLTTPDQAPGLTDLDENAAFLTLFHDHDWEPYLLKEALKTPAIFVGCLGSQAAQDQRKAILASMGVSDDALSRIHGPIGLVGALRDAQLIAISAMAQITAVVPAHVIRVTDTARVRAATP
ncbi:MAG: XdhC family protein [Pseudomonadota bacterium]